MKNSCNGCRVLRKGCSDDCTLRPCLDWIESPKSQANATLFLAKFYGRTGLINLINAGPNNFSPAIFRSLLYEACGRIVNPVSGSVGLMWSNKWDSCQSAVDSVLSGTPLVQSWPQDLSELTMPFDHLVKDQNRVNMGPDPVTELRTGSTHAPFVEKCEPEEKVEIGLELSLGLNGGERVLDL